MRRRAEEERVLQGFLEEVAALLAGKPIAQVRQVDGPATAQARVEATAALLPAATRRHRHPGEQSLLLRRPVANLDRIPEDNAGLPPRAVPSTRQDQLAMATATIPATATTPTSRSCDRHTDTETRTSRPRVRGNVYHFLPRVNPLFRTPFSFGRLSLSSLITSSFYRV